MVPKKDRSWQPCGDYRRCNLVPTPDKYPLQNMQDLSNGLHGCTVFSKIGLVEGYHQIPVAGEDIPKTAIITPFGLFEYLLTPFGLSNAAQTFQRMMDLTALATNGLAINLEKCVFAAPFLEILGHTIWRPLRPITPPLPTPLGHQTTTTFSRHGKFLPPFSAQMHTSFAPFD